MNATCAAGAGVRTTCPYCGVGCGLLRTGGRARRSGDHRRSDPPGESRTASARRAQRWARPSVWTADCCIRCCGKRRRARTRELGCCPRSSRERLSNVIAHHGPEAVAFYLSGQLLTEDYYVANKLMKGFIGSANVDTNSRLCMASSVAGHRRAFGADTVPGIYADLDEADLIVLVGSNAAWCHPVLFQRMVAQQDRTRRADRGHRPSPHRNRRGSRSFSVDRAWNRHGACGAACWCELAGWRRASITAYVDAYTTGYAAALAAAREIAPDIATTARATGFGRRPTSPASSICSADTSAGRHLLFAGREPVGTGHRQGQCHHQLPSGNRAHRRARHGSVLADRPAQRHGRARGRWARQSACCAYGVLVAEIDRVRRFWNAPRMAEREGHKAVEMFRSDRGAARSGRCG